MAETRPKDYPKLNDYKPSRFMLPTSHYDKAKADRAVAFIENLRHTKGKWAGKAFLAAPMAGADHPGSLWHRGCERKTSVPDCFCRNRKEEREV